MGLTGTLVLGAHWDTSGMGNSHCLTTAWTRLAEGGAGAGLEADPNQTGSRNHANLEAGLSQTDTEKQNLHH